MAHCTHLLLLVQLLCLTAAVTTASTSASFHANLNHPYASSPLSTHEVIRRFTCVSRARLVRLNATLTRHLTGIFVPVAPLAD
ncbi:unnamed protein product [Urochloa humidicola]